MAAIRLTFGVGFLLVALFAATQAQTTEPATLYHVEYNVSSSTEDYINDNWRQYNATIANFQTQIDAQKAIFQAQLKVIDVQSQLIELKLQDSNEKLLPLELLSTLTKHCVQKFRGEMPTSEILTKLQQCVSNARGYEYNLFSLCNTNINSLSYYYKNTLQTALNNCKKYSPNLGLNHTICVTKAISAANTYTASMRKTFASNMRSLQCSIDNRVNYAIECAFEYSYNITAGIGQTERLIENCIYGELQPPCTQNCPVSIELPFSVMGVNNATINNPFYGLKSSDIKCLQVHFYTAA